MRVFADATVRDVVALVVSGAARRFSGQAVGSERAAFTFVVETARVYEKPVKPLVVRAKLAVSMRSALSRTATQAVLSVTGASALLKAERSEQTVVSASALATSAAAVDAAVNVVVVVSLFSRRPPLLSYVLTYYRFWCETARQMSF